MTPEDEEVWTNVEVMLSELVIEHILDGKGSGCILCFD